jgi:hypothetical protein
MTQDPWREIATSTTVQREETDNPHLPAVTTTTVVVGELEITINQSVTREDYVIVTIDGDLTDDGNRALYVVVNDNEVWDSETENARHR